jgi:hypothetical protein
MRGRTLLNASRVNRLAGTVYLALVAVASLSIAVAGGFVG